FFCYGDDADDERDETGRPTYLRHPEYFDPQEEPYRDLRDCYAPLVWQCKFSGIEVPDALWRFAAFGKEHKYSENQAEDMDREPEFLHAFDDWTDRFAAFVGAKGKVEPGKYRAYGHKTPGHTWADVKLYSRDWMMRIGHPPAGSSPDKQQDLGLNKDETLSPKKGEGERLRGR
nr:hypothetical protein [Burkholderiales bacterium]